MATQSNGHGNGNGNGTGNRLLDKLPEEEFNHIRRLLEPMALDCKHDLYRVNDPISYLYFPRTGVVSLVVVMKDGKQVEVASVGNEGLIGLTAVHGLDVSPHLVTCQVPGQGLRAPARPFVQALERNRRLSHVLTSYTAVTLRLANQIIACNALHPVEERMSRWLLMTHDRVGADAFPLTQEYLAQMLGVRRQTVTVVAGVLQKQGLITYHRGEVHIQDRPGLEQAACECYEAMNGFYERALGNGSSSPRLS